jgi:hypothetical protein
MRQNQQWIIGGIIAVVLIAAIALALNNNTDNDSDYKVNTPDQTTNESGQNQNNESDTQAPSTDTSTITNPKTFSGEGYTISIPGDWTYQSVQADDLFMSPEALANQKYNNTNCANQGAECFKSGGASLALSFTPYQPIPNISTKDSGSEKKVTLGGREYNSFMVTIKDGANQEKIQYYETTINGKTYSFRHQNMEFSELIKNIISTFKVQS